MVPGWTTSPAKIALAMTHLPADDAASMVRQNIVFALGVKAAGLLLGALGIADISASTVFADVGVMIIAVLNATRALYTKKPRRKIKDRKQRGYKVPRKTTLFVVNRSCKCQ